MMETKLMSFVTNLPEQTENAGEVLGRYFADNSISDCFVAMYGDLGSGKTAFVRGMARVLSPSAEVCSPTYTVVNDYSEKSVNFFHFDMYRISDEEDLYSIGFYDYMGIMAVEWCEKIPYALPDRYIKVEIIKTGEKSRNIAVTEVVK